MRDKKDSSGLILVLSAAAFFSMSESTVVYAADAAISKPANPAAKKSAAKAAASKPSKSQAKGKITEDGAVNLVKAMPEVKQFFKDVKNSKISKPAIDMDRKEGNAYVVHVYEIVNDGPDASHTATKNWYYVNIKTGTITKEF